MDPDLIECCAARSFGQDRCAPLRGGLRPVLTEAARGAVGCTGPGQESGPSAEQKSGGLLKEGLQSKPRLKNEETPLSRTKKLTPHTHQRFAELDAHYFVRKGAATLISNLDRLAGPRRAGDSRPTPHPRSGGAERAGLDGLAAVRLARAQAVMVPLALRASVSGRSSSTRSCRTFGVIRTTANVREPVDVTAGLQPAVSLVVGLSPDEKVWDATTFTHNGEPLQGGDIFQTFMTRLLNHPQVRPLLSDEHFLGDGTLIEAWASQKSFRPKDVSDPDGNHFHGQRRKNETHASATQARRKSPTPSPSTLRLHLRHEPYDRRRRL